jgi:hypothetical protein
MVEIAIKDNKLIIELMGMHKYFALKNRIDVPIDHVSDVRLDPKANIYRDGLALRMPGTSLPGVVTAGSFLQRGKWSFWDVSRPQNAITIELHHERYSRLVVEVEHPQNEVSRIRYAMDECQSRP